MTHRDDVPEWAVKAAWDLLPPRKRFDVEVDRVAAIIARHHHAQPTSCPNCTVKMKAGDGVTICRDCWENRAKRATPLQKAATRLVSWIDTKGKNSPLLFDETVDKLREAIARCGPSESGSPKDCAHSDHEGGGGPKTTSRSEWQGVAASGSEPEAGTTPDTDTPEWMIQFVHDIHGEIEGDAPGVETILASLRHHYDCKRSPDVDVRFHDSWEEPWMCPASQPLIELARLDHGDACKVPWDRWQDALRSALTLVKGREEDNRDADRENDD